MESPYEIYNKTPTYPMDIGEMNALSCFLPIGNKSAYEMLEQVIEASN